MGYRGSISNMGYRGTNQGYILKWTIITLVGNSQSVIFVYMGNKYAGVSTYSFL